jgi:hypothetical protein
VPLPCAELGPNRSFERTHVAGNLKALAAMYTADACRMPPNARAVQDRDGVLATLRMITVS